MAKMGRPPIQIDSGDFQKLCGMQCTLTEIAGFFSCSEDTVERWCKREYKVTFAEAFKKYSAGGKISLRRAQFELAKHSAAMAIWLGRNYLGQRDHFELEDSDALKRAKELLGSVPSAID